MPKCYASIPDAPTRSQVKKAVRALRQWFRAPGYDVPEEVAVAWMVVSNYRAGFQKPLDKVTIQLRRYVGYEVRDVIVAQRLKRMPTILNTLARQPTMDLTRMQDIGGCRAVLPSSDRVDSVLGRIDKHWTVDPQTGRGRRRRLRVHGRAVAFLVLVLCGVCITSGMRCAGVTSTPSRTCSASPTRKQRYGLALSAEPSTELIAADRYELSRSGV